MKILFLEDRPSRQLLYLPNKKTDAEIIHSLDGVFMPDSVECKNIINNINQVKYDFDSDLKLIIVHKSALETKGLMCIHDFCKKNKVKFVCFSGGVSQLTYNNEEYEFININSTDFYTDRLISFLKNFLDNTSETLLELVNNEWKLSYMFLARQIIGSLLLEKDEDAKFNLQEKLDKTNTILNLAFSINDGNKTIIENLNLEIKKRILSV